jgi:hypothetical protein
MRPVRTYSSYGTTAWDSAGTTGVVIQCVVCGEPTGYPVEASYPLRDLRLDLLSNAWAPVFKRSAEGRWQTNLSSKLMTRSDCETGLSIDRGR